MTEGRITVDARTKRPVVTFKGDADWLRDVAARFEFAARMGQLETGGPREAKVIIVREGQGP